MSLFWLNIAKSVRTDNSPWMYYNFAADFNILSNCNIGMYYGVVSNRHFVTYVCTGKYDNTISYSRIAMDIC